MRAVWARRPSGSARHLEKSLKKPEKSAEKQLTTVSVCDKIAKLSEADVRNAERSSSDEKIWKNFKKHRKNSWQPNATCDMICELLQAAGVIQIPVKRKQKSFQKKIEKNDEKRLTSQ